MTQYHTYFVLYLVLFICWYIIVDLMEVFAFIFEPPKYIFTLTELVEMDREDEPHWNDSQSACARASQVGEDCTNPRYVDYRGILRDAFTHAPICDNHEDRRRVVNGKVVSKHLIPLPNGTYQLRTI